MVKDRKSPADDAHERFNSCGCPHVLMITNHGVHEWQVIPGLTDTGGQNVYVNQFTEALVAQDYRVTIVNRGGYRHPKTRKMQRGIVYHPSDRARIMYVEDGLPHFVRKEDMNEQLPRLCEDLCARLDHEGNTCELIISHYWDGGKLGALFNESHKKPIKHIWVPHSLGALKKRNMDPSTWDNLRIDERIDHERRLLEVIDGAVATSSVIRDTFLHDYGHEARYFLPPCVDEVRFHPRAAEEIEPIWSFLSAASGHGVPELKRRKFVTEISRTDTTKRKDVLIKAFAQVVRQVPEAMLLVSIDPHAGALHDALLELIKTHNLKNDVIVLGSVWDQLPLLYNITHVFCTPSVMEGFGMSAQEAAATGKPVISSNLVPFVCEYLLGPMPQRARWDRDPSRDLLFGSGGVVVPADFTDGFASAIVRLLTGDEQRDAMGAEALRITIPYFTWRHMTERLLFDLGVSTDGKPAVHAPASTPGGKVLVDTLIETWAVQGRDGFLLTHPADVDIPTREAVDPASGVPFRFRWMPHRELRGDVAELERRGILNPRRDEGKLFRDVRDPNKQHCFLCAANIAECHPMEVLVPLQLGGGAYFAGANFAWIEHDHFTVMSAEHTDQAYSHHVLEAMLDLHLQTAGRFRVLYNGPGAGATIPWHLHFQITTTPMPIERLLPGHERQYPTTVHSFRVRDNGLEGAEAAARDWLAGDSHHRSLNILVTAIDGGACVFVFPRDQRQASASGKGLVGGFEVAGDFVLSAPREEDTFRNASAATARAILSQIRPGD